MRHQLFKKGTYVEINVGKSHLMVVGKVKDSKIEHRRIQAEEIFNIPQASIELESKLLIVYENPEIKPKLLDDISFINGIIEGFDGIAVKEGRLFASIYDLDTPGEELKQLYYKLNQGAK